ncbi:hypothetical protein ACT8ZS_17640 [Paenibacillus sp. M.A.Huq-84]
MDWLWTRTIPVVHLITKTKSHRIDLDEVEEGANKPRPAAYVSGLAPSGGSNPSPNQRNVLVPVDFLLQHY